VLLYHDQEYRGHLICLQLKALTFSLTVKIIGQGSVQIQLIKISLNLYL